MEHILSSDRVTAITANTLPEGWPKNPLHGTSFLTQAEKAVENGISLTVAAHNKIRLGPQTGSILRPDYLQINPRPGPH